MRLLVALFLLLLMHVESRAAEPLFRKNTVKLDDGISMKAVENLLGSPDQTESKTCGTKTKDPWACRTWTYRYGTEHLTILFQQSAKDGWIVNAWYWVP